MAQVFSSFSFLDASGEPGSLKLPLKTTASGVQADAIRTALEPMSSMLLRSWIYGTEYVLSSAQGNGAREMKILVRCYDSVNGQKFSFSIPGFATGINLIAGTDFLDLDDTEAAALVTAIQAAVVTPWYDNLVTVASMERTRGQK